MPHQTLQPNHWMDALSDSSWMLWTSQLPERVSPSYLLVLWRFVCFSLMYKRIQKLFHCPHQYLLKSVVQFSLCDVLFVLDNNRCPHYFNRQSPLTLKQLLKSHYCVVSMWFEMLVRLQPCTIPNFFTILWQMDVGELLKERSMLKSANFCPMKMSSLIIVCK